MNILFFKLYCISNKSPIIYPCFKKYFVTNQFQEIAANLMQTYYRILDNDKCMVGQIKKQIQVLYFSPPLGSPVSCLFCSWMVDLQSFTEWW